ncbi:MAG: chorismate mutase [Chloroflexi bacterium]|nr:chorismate mutase [Chloroflexota bacterium]
MTMTCRGIRGATTAENTAESIHEATEEMLGAMLKANGLKGDQIAAAYFTATPDLTAAFPSTAARLRLGWEHVALLDSQQMEVEGAMPGCIRVLLLVNTEQRPEELVNIYLRGATNLRATTRA